MNTRVLVVEDELIVAESLTRFLGSQGYDVVGTAATGAKAIEQSASQQPDIVLMDIKLKGAMDGIAAAERIRTDCDIPIVFVTAFGDDSTLERAKRARPCGFLLKPIKERELRVSIETALHEFDLERKLIAADKALKQANDELEERIRARTAQLAAEVAERRRAEAAVQAERQRLDTVLETLPVYVVLLSPDYRVPFANRTFRERFGESDGRRCYEHLFGRTEPCEECHSFEPFTTGQSAQWRWHGPDGRDYEIYDFPFSDTDGSRLVLEMGIDITERLQAESALQAAHATLESKVVTRTTELLDANSRLRAEVEERLRAEEALRRAKEEWERTFDSVPDLIAIIDHDGRIQRVNRAMTERLGARNTAWLGAPCYATIHNIDHRPDYCPHALTLADGQEHSVEVHEPQLGGDFLVTTAPLRDEGGTMVGTVHVARDITEQKLAERALREASELLEVRVRERTLELAIAVEELRRVNRELHTLGECNQAMVRAETEAELLERVCRAIVADGWYSGATVELIDAAGAPRLRVTAAATGDVAVAQRGQHAEPTMVDSATAVLEARALASGTPQTAGNLDDLAPDEPSKAGLRAAGLQSAIALPLGEPGRWLGVLSIVGPAAGFCGEGENRRLDELADDIAYAVRALKTASDHRLAGDALRASEATLRAFYDSPGVMRGMVELLPRDLRLVSANAVAAAAFGRGADEIPGLLAGALHLPEDVIALWRSRCAESRTTGRPAQCEYPLTADGRERHFRATFVRIGDAAAEPPCLAFTVEDVTEQKELEARFLRSQRLESIGTLAGGLAHDLNNALGPILIGADLLRLMHRDERTRATLDSIEASARRGAAIVRQVLTFARGAHGHMATLSPAHAVHELEKMVRATFPRSIEVRVELQDQGWSIHGDATQIHQVLMNLSLNARDAMPDGGLLTISASNVGLDELSVQVSPGAAPGPYVVLAVTDSGSGVPPETLDHIFDPFFTTKPSGKGTGLGLSTALGIVKSHGGFIVVHSEVGRGSSFEVYLPAADPQAQEAARISAPTPRTGKGELILVVDDEEVIRSVTEQVLVGQGYRVLTAADGTEVPALYSRKGSEIAAVLLDLDMPFANGPTTIRILRRMNPSVRIVVMTGQLDYEGRLQDLGGPCPNVLEKPFSSAQLLQMLAEILPAAES